MKLRYPSKLRIWLSGLVPTVLSGKHIVPHSEIGPVDTGLSKAGEVGDYFILGGEKVVHKPQEPDEEG